MRHATKLDFSFSIIEVSKIICCVPFAKSSVFPLKLDSQTIAFKKFEFQFLIVNTLQNILLYWTLLASLTTAFCTFVKHVKDSCKIATTLACYTP